MILKLLGRPDETQCLHFCYLVKRRQHRRGISMARSVAWITVFCSLSASTSLEQVPVFDGWSNIVALRNLFISGGSVYSYLVILWKSIFYLLLLRFIYSSIPIRSDGAAMNALLFNSTYVEPATLICLTSTADADNLCKNAGAEL